MSEVYDLYLFHRAETELARARGARQPEARRVHEELASRYLDRFYAARAIGARPSRPE